MIESGLFFLAGFLSAIVLALIVAPAIWRRAVFLTRKRIESAVPLTVSELQADKDRLRAEHAIAQRKLDMALKKQRDATSEQAGQASALQRSLQDIRSTLDARETELEAERRETGHLRLRVHELESEIAEIKLEFGTAQATLVARTAEHEGASRLRGAAEAQLKKARADLEKRTGAMARLEAQLGQARQAQRAHEETARARSADAVQTAGLLKSETERADRLAARLAELENVKGSMAVEVRNRHKQITKLRKSRAGEEAEFDELEQRARDAEAQRAEMEHELGEMTVLVNRITKLLDGKSPELAIEGMQARIAQLSIDADAEHNRAEAAEARLARLAEEDDALRKEMATLAAQVIEMAAALEGDASPIPTILAQPTPDADPDARASLAARVKAARSEAMAEAAGEERPSA